MRGRFWRNLAEVVANLPLVLSDSYSAKDVSLNRVLIVVMAVLAVALVELLAARPQVAVVLLPVLQSLMGLIGAQLGVNLVKRGIKAFGGRGGNEE